MTGGTSRIVAGAYSAWTSSDPLLESVTKPAKLLSSLTGGSQPELLMTA